MHAIPTLYRGVQYRSRLEAKWAAFFDLIGWKYQYEPFDLKGWIPDFQLMSRHGVLVEVKPVLEFPRPAVEKIDRACPDADQEILIVGSTIPLPESRSDRWMAIGWLRQTWYMVSDKDRKWGFYEWSTALFGGWDGAIGLCAEESCCSDRFSGAHDYYVPPNRDLLLDKWNAAGNAVQWRGTLSQTGTNR